MHVYTWLAHLDIRIDQNTPFLIKKIQKHLWGIPPPHPTFSGEENTHSPRHTPSAPSHLDPRAIGARPSCLQTKCLDPPLFRIYHSQTLSSTRRLQLLSLESLCVCAYVVYSVTCSNFIWFWSHTTYWREILLIYYITMWFLSTNSFFLIFHDGSVAFIFYVCLFYIFSLHA